MTNRFTFEIQTKILKPATCTGRITTAHGREIETPVFMPVGTQGTVKALTQTMLEEDGCANYPGQYLSPLSAAYA